MAHRSKAAHLVAQQAADARHAHFLHTTQDWLRLSGMSLTRYTIPLFITKAISFYMLVKSTLRITYS